MRIGSILVALLVSVPAVHAEKVQLLDPAFFGHPTSEPIKPLYERRANEVEPYLVQVDILCGRYRAATVFYQGPATYSDVRASLNARYGEHEARLPPDDELLPGLWRIVDEDGWPLAIQLSDDSELEGAISVIYIRNAEWVAECEGPARPEK